MTNIWTAEERSARMLFRFDDGSFYEQRLVQQYLDPYSQKAPEFSLYYFIKDQTFDNKVKPTILFAAGGPGQMILPDTTNFVDMFGYRVVYFHLRGTGFSQVPDGVDADQFLRTRYVVKDMEKIRQDLGLRRWDAVIGHSYGCVVAQDYARQYPDNVRKIVLSAPMAPMRALRASTGEPNLNEQTQGALVFDILRKLYRLPEFKFFDRQAVRERVKGDAREYILGKVRKIVKAVEDKYWSVQSVGDNYDKLKQVLRKDGLNCGPTFFGAVRRLQSVGWLPLNVPYARPIKTPKVDDTQVQCGLVIAKAILRRVGVDVEEILTDGVVKSKLADGERLLGGKSTQNTARAYHIFSYYDGLNDRFFGVAGVRGLSHVKGTVPAAFLVGAQNEQRPKPWDPNTYKHGKPTLILKGGADPVTEEGEAEYYFEEALTGERALVEFPGIGHSMALPYLPTSMEGILKVQLKKKKIGKASFAYEERALSTRDKLIHDFLRGKSVDSLQRRPIVRALKKAFAARIKELPSGFLDANDHTTMTVKTAAATDTVIRPSLKDTIRTQAVKKRVGSKQKLPHAQLA